MSIPFRRRSRTTPIALAPLPILAVIMLAVIIEAFVALPALAVEPFHFPAVLRSGKKIGDLVPGLSALDDVVKTLRSTGATLSSRAPGATKLFGQLSREFTRICGLHSA
ncbi:MAG TPA: hypothetical protein VNF49_09465 [Candidatus Binataceae bacterium]|nr:hypothetical protein [Candidatus Binataceae bacterium]